MTHARRADTRLRTLGWVVAALALASAGHTHAQKVVAEVEFSFNDSDPAPTEGWEPNGRLLLISFQQNASNVTASTFRLFSPSGKTVAEGAVPDLVGGPAVGPGGQVASIYPRGRGLYGLAFERAPNQHTLIAMKAGKGGLRKLNSVDLPAGATANQSVVFENAGYVVVRRATNQTEFIRYTPTLKERGRFVGGPDLRFSRLGRGKLLGRELPATEPGQARFRLLNGRLSEQASLTTDMGSNFEMATSGRGFHLSYDLPDGAGSRVQILNQQLSASATLNFLSAEISDFDMLFGTLDPLNFPGNQRGLANETPAREPLIYRTVSESFANGIVTRTVQLIRP